MSERPDPMDLEELRGLLGKAGLTRLVADLMPPDCKEFEPGWRIHDMPENDTWARFIAEGLEKDQADHLVAAVNSLPALLDRVERLEGALRPFARCAERLNGDIADAVNVWPGSFTVKWFTGTRPLFNASDLRRARLALSPQKEGENG